MIEGHFKKMYPCNIFREIKVDSTILDMVVVSYDKKSKEIGHIVGIEIKSDRDSLKRAEKQLNSYYKVCDKVYLALGERKTPSNLPLGIGVIRIKEKSVDFEKVAESIYNNIPLTKKSLAFFNKINGTALDYSTFSRITRKVDIVRKKILLTKILSSKSKNYTPIELEKSEKDIVEMLSILLNR